MSRTGNKKRQQRGGCKLEPHKVRYEYLTTAIRACKRLLKTDGIKMRAYGCKECNGFHLTSKKKIKKSEPDNSRSVPIDDSLTVNTTESVSTESNLDAEPVVLTEHSG